MRALCFLLRYQTAQFLVSGITTTPMRGIVDEMQHMDIEYTFFSSL